MAVYALTGTNLLMHSHILLCWLASCLGTLFISIEIGLAISVGLAIALALYQSAFPHTAVLGRINGSVPVYR